MRYLRLLSQAHLLQKALYLPLCQQPYCRRNKDPVQCSLILGSEVFLLCLWLFRFHQIQQRQKLLGLQHNNRK